MQHSNIFEPLYSLQAHNMEEICLQAPKPAFTSQALSLFSISPPSPPSSLVPANNRENPPSSFDQKISCSLHAHIITPSSSSNYKKARSEQDLTSDLTHVKLPLPHPTPPPCSINGNSKLPLSHSTTFFTPKALSTACSNSDDDCKCDDDDGSVASKLLSSITKSMSSPSLHCKSSKEAARETSYQKTLKLKQMKLQHCAEALGMESSDNSSFLYDSQYIHQEKIDMIGNPSRCPPSFPLSNSHQESSLKSVKSAPNLSSAPPLMTNHPRYTRSKSFPPPLSHTLPTSSSYDSLSLSLRAYREDGRFILKETMVPSKNYFHANRENGRLTLHVFTREAEEEEQEEEILECRQVSLYEEEGFDNKEDYSTSTIQSLNEQVCVKKSLGMDTSKENKSHLNMSLHRLNCYKNKEEGDDNDKRNVISNVITLRFQTSNHSNVTLHKAQVLSFPHLPLVSGTLKQSALIHSADMNQGLLPSNHDMSTFTQSNENFIWESNLMPRGVSSGSPRKQRKGSSGSGSGGGGGGGGGAALPAFVMEEMRAKSLMKVVSELASSLILEASCARGNWCLARKKKQPLSAVDSGERGTIIGGYMASAIKSGKITGDEGQISHGANFGYNTNEEEKASEGGIKELNTTSSALNLDLQFPSSNANLQSEEWLHTFHCKELFDRHQLGQGFMKLQCIPTRS